MNLGMPGRPGSENEWAETICSAACYGLRSMRQRALIEVRARIHLMLCNEIENREHCAPWIFFQIDSQSGLCRFFFSEELLAASYDNNDSKGYKKDSKDNLHSLSECADSC